ncbi:MAG: LacI family DNA-binding transcriptional regulator [Paraglaciecola sp.]|uniref:LacI family DNA-binding transcriptional regulator n=1 Tax=Alteromonadaceae TaxID=72275 RepID=UPI00274014B9|nr:MULTISPECIES: LacI family DNA-binding transcriptional regulator [Alteromonadaceae]MDP5032047.1 LacI family DNA-binding transcriptional regulator [Paraglaciecola sp.]MDP5133944.1 LacI family DNA-binding transcriptional regulator [Paraglaciecola sp.]MDP5206062.1 LacI family DNA-binding transcriptional regulator [Alishewanella sp. SMS9]MDP5458536.1 LacI family DNA-binding transcriptional regulator [Alishewanella sp. SMS8]
MKKAVKVMTLADIAKLAGVSESTASRALRDNPVINAKTREKVQLIAASHQFKVNATARSLRTQKSNTIAVIILFDSKTQQAISDPFLLDLLGVIADELTAKGYDMLLSTSKTTDKDWRNYYYDSKRADGLIVIGQGEHDDRVEQLASAGVPFVVWGAATGAETFPVIGSDNRQGAHLAVAHLIEQGCKRIAFLGDIRHTEIEMRYLGYKDALQAASIEIEEGLQFNTDFTAQAGYLQTQQALFQQINKLEGIFAASDAIAMGAMKALLEHGINVPQQVAIVGFDDIAMSAYGTPSLTTVKQNTYAGGQLLVDKLLKQMEGFKVTSQLLPVKLIKRQSTQRLQKQTL